MRTRGHHGAGNKAGQRAGAVALVSLAMLAVGAGSPAHAADQPGPAKGGPTGTAPKNEQPTQQRLGSQPEVKPEPKPEKDRTPPARPTLGEASVAAGGAVSVEVQAESGSAVVVREGAKVVASGSAIGTPQLLTWDSKSGPHTFLVVATDAAGNVSDPAPVTLEVDATPPAASGFAVKAGTARDSRSTWSVTTEPGTAYALVVSGKTVQEGIAQGRAVKGSVDIANGSHQVELQLRDEVGNLRTLDQKMTVDIPALRVVAKDVSEDNATERTIKIAAPPATRGFLRIPGAGSRRFEIPEGRAAVTMRVEEGKYGAPVVIVADTLDRKGTTRLAPFEVDFTAPAVLVETTPGAGARGLLSATITAGEGDTVSWRLVDDRGVPSMSGEFVADGTAQLLEREAGEGAYELEVTATDANGNTTIETSAAPIEARPMINPDVVPALTITLVLWALVGLAAFLRRRARRLQKLAGGLAGGVARGRRPRNKRGQVMAEHVRAVAEYEEQLAAFELEDRAWEERRAELAQLVDVAKGGAVDASRTAVEVRPEERVLCVLPAGLIEVQQHDGAEVPVQVGDGQLVVTTDRVAFAGTENREWALDELESIRHLGQDRTLMKLAGDDSNSGVSYADADLVRLYLELAMAEHAGDSRSVRIMLEQGVRSHELRRPQAPKPVGPAPVHGRRARRNDVRPEAPAEAPVGAPVEASFGRAIEAGVDRAPVTQPPAMVSQHGEPVDEQISRELALYR